MASDYVLPNVSAIAILLLMLVNGRQLEVGNAHLPMARTKVPEPDFLNLSGEKKSKQRETPKSTCFTEGKRPKTQASILPMILSDSQTLRIMVREESDSQERK